MRKLERPLSFISYLAVSPSHNHVSVIPTPVLLASYQYQQAFLALDAGEIRTYDLLCLRKSPYIMPNMWKLYETKLLVSGEPTTSRPLSYVFSLALCVLSIGTSSSGTGRWNPSFIPGI